ncbi:PaaI family thioesterase [Aquicoccus porphyridii]|uniref:PaaI family thioesterase n=2 Tax=Aquicoccus TaxID=2055850 RepID=A0A5A9ZU20_9RHOB|nr:PaaI family thioesterase [Aquicoccus porphyridii]KAA0920858.1 PaaI family thioesterase [Aquicoccus porphyridii]RAI56599.1 thioesterase [Rhodobacteraceae bacterium AsT-22]
MPLQMNAEELMAYLEEVFPQVRSDFAVDRLAEMEVDLRLKVADRHLRPGGTVSGPSMFSLADCAVYAITLAMVGRRALAVTTNATIDFMRKPAAGADLIAQCRLLKLGRVLAVGDVLIFSEGEAAPVARASLTYSLPPGGG